MPTLFTPECTRSPIAPYGRATREPKFRRDVGPNGMESHYIISRKTGVKLWYSPMKKRWVTDAERDEA